MNAEGSLTMEETAEEYYTELIMRNFLQPYDEEVHGLVLVSAIKYSCDSYQKKNLYSFPRLGRLAREKQAFGRAYSVWLPNVIKYIQ